MFSREWIGSIAAFCTTIAFLPQVFLIWKTKKTEGISLAMYLIFSSGLALWIVYGVMCGSYPLICANTITLALALIVIALKLKSK